MLTKNLFRKPKIQLEDAGPQAVVTPSVPDEMCVSCSGCDTVIWMSELIKNVYVCPKCGKHFRVGARKRIGLICDEGSFEEMDAGMASVDRIGFPEYETKLRSARIDSNESDAVLTGTASFDGVRCAVFAMEAYFMMGSMGTVVGEKITRLFELATESHLPVVGWTVSGGARVQEGILSLMQMAKTSGAVKRHSDAGNLYICVLTDPTTGGVDASFAMEADVTLAEPGALIGFAGPRVIEQTIRQRLPQGFQRAEFQLEKGFVDRITDRRSQHEEIAAILKLHAGVTA